MFNLFYFSFIGKCISIVHLNLNNRHMQREPKNKDKSEISLTIKCILNDIR